MRLFLQKKTPLGTEDMPLGRFVAGYRWSSPLYIEDQDVLYLASSHEVRCRAVVPGGPQGFLTFKIPAHVKTLEELLKHLKKDHGFILKK